MKVHQKQSVIKLEIYVKNVMGQNVDLEQNQQNVHNVKVKVMWILDKDQCRYKWVVNNVKEQDRKIQVHVWHVKVKVLLIKQEQKQLIFQLVWMKVRV